MSLSSCVDWMLHSAIDSDDSDSSTDVDEDSQLTQSTPQTPFRLSYAYLLPYSDVTNSPSPPIRSCPHAPTFISTAVSPKYRLDSIDSNATLLATPSPKSLHPFNTPTSHLSPKLQYSPDALVRVIPIEASVSSPFGHVYYIQEQQWDPLSQDISPVLRARQENPEQLSKGAEENIETTDISARIALDACQFPRTPNTSIERSNGSLTPLTPLTPLSCTRNTSISPTTFDKTRRKRRKTRKSTAARQIKKPRTSSNHDEIELKENISDNLRSDVSHDRPVYTCRTLPESVPCDLNYALLYRRFPISCYLKLDPSNSPCSLFNVSHPGGVFNPPRSALDLYTPRFVKGKGADKLGLCPICIEPLHRGGEGKSVWLAMKFSAYKYYHMQYAHGVSSSTGRPYSPPISIRVVARLSPKKNERTTMQEGKCHRCEGWVPMQGVKDVAVKVKELFWWKHAATCHGGAGILGEKDFYETDHVWEQMKQLSVI